MREDDEDGSKVDIHLQRVGLNGMVNESKVSLPDAEVHEFSDEKQLEDEEPNRFHCSTLRARLRYYIHHHYFQILICVLVLLDTAVVVTEIMVDSSNHDGSVNHDIVVAEHILHYTSLAILSFFMLEIIVKIFAMGRDFLRHKIEVFDAVVVTVSFLLDIFLSSGGLKDGVEFLILLRLWRITRIINGIIMSIKARGEEREKKLQDEKVSLEERCCLLQEKLEVLEIENRRLTALIESKDV